jgi:hypothetical protein
VLSILLSMDGSYSSLRLTLRDNRSRLEGCSRDDSIVSVVAIGLAMTGANTVKEVKTMWNFG